MTLPGVKYVGGFGDHTGMGEACRNAIVALNKADVPLTVERRIHTKEKIDHGRAFNICSKLQNQDIEYMFQILHLTPDCFLKAIEQLKYNIGHFFWETDRVKSLWAWHMNIMNEIWTGTEMTKKALEESGVQVPIFVFPQAINTVVKEMKPFRITPLQGFVFYSIIEWIERKNPKDLLQAYWREFETEDDVTLLIKSFVRGKSPTDAMSQIKKDILEWKAELDQTHFPRVLITTQLLSRNDMTKFHYTGDCFVSAHRGEGWGLPQVEAMLCKKPVISTKYGGVHEWITDEHAFLIDYTLTNVFNMESNYYERSQRWASPSFEQLRKHMRYVFTAKNKREIGYKTRKAYNFITKNFSYQAVGQIMRDRLEEIAKEYTEEKVEGKKE